MKVVIDTDAGCDDAIAILMALKLLPKDSLMAITTVFGNVPTHQANHNVRTIVAQGNHHHSYVPIYSGAHKPILSSVASPWHGHGPDGLGV